jgi:S1-C subfamily serine protease
LKKFASILIILFLLIAGNAYPEGEINIEKSVVRIVNNSQRGIWYAPWDSFSVEKSSGSGFVINGNLIMTNAHVVSDARMLIIYLYNDPTPYEARVTAIGHDCDLALIEPVDSQLLQDIPVVTFDELPDLRSTVETYGYPAGGERISSTKGIISRIEMKKYVHSGIDLHLSIQTDAAINPGNSGGPVVQNGKVVGVAFQAISSLNNVGYFIPTEETGIMVETIFSGSSADGYLYEGDVILAVEGQTVANDGTIVLNGIRLDFEVLLDRKQVGEQAFLSILRNSENIQINIPLYKYETIQRTANIYDRLPRYYIYAGLVFIPLNRESLKTYGKDWVTEADKNLFYECMYKPFEVSSKVKTEPVILLRRLDHQVNANMAFYKNLVVEKINGRSIDRLEDLIEAIETNEEDFHVLEFGYFGRFSVIDRKKSEEAHKDILKKYGIKVDRRL